MYAKCGIETKLSYLPLREPRISPFHPTFVTIKPPIGYSHYKITKSGIIHVCYRGGSLFLCVFDT